MRCMYAPVQPGYRAGRHLPGQGKPGQWNHTIKLRQTHIHGPGPGGEEAASQVLSGQHDPVRG